MCKYVHRSGLQKDPWNYTQGPVAVVPLRQVHNASRCGQPWHGFHRATVKAAESRILILLYNVIFMTANINMVYDQVTDFMACSYLHICLVLSGTKRLPEPVTLWHR